jgi:hypothetical protein
MNSIYTIQHASPSPDLGLREIALPDDATLLSLARLSGFVRRSLRRLDLRGFVCSCVLLALEKCPSLSTQAVLVGMCSGTTISKQGLHKRLSAMVAPFLQACVSAVLVRRLAQHWPRLKPLNFARVLIQDSTCVPLSPALAKRFPGAANQSGRVQAGLRVQCLYELLAERFVWFRVGAFTRNDQAAAGEVLCSLQPDDLLIRDLGYFSLQSMRGIASAGAFFLSRLRYAVKLFDAESTAPLDLARLLRPGMALDRPVRVGSDGLLAARLIAVPLPEAVANERRRKALADRDRRLRHCDDYLYLLGWTLLITNAPAERLPGELANRLYRLRWRIEIVFKAWKSHFRLERLASVGPRQVEPLLYGSLLLIVLTHHQPLPDPVVPHHSDTLAVAGEPAHPRSLLRFSALLADWLPVLLFAGLPTHELFRRFAAQVYSHARYERRRRKNHLDLRSDVLG